MHLIGDVEGCNALVVDDIIDTAGTLTKSVEALKAKGAQRVLAAGVHGILSGPALKRIASSPLEMVLITNTTPVEDKLAKLPKLRPLSVAPLLGEAIRRIHENMSVGALFSSEVDFTQELLLWEEGVAKKLDIRIEPDPEADRDPAPVGPGFAAD